MWLCVKIIIIQNKQQSLSLFIFDLNDFIYYFVFGGTVRIVYDTVKAIKCMLSVKWQQNQNDNIISSNTRNTKHKTQRTKNKVMNHERGILDFGLMSVELLLFYMNFDLNSIDMHMLIARLLHPQLLIILNHFQIEIERRAKRQGNDNNIEQC